MKKALSLRLVGVMVLSLSGCVSSTGSGAADLVNALAKAGSAAADAESSEDSTAKSNSNTTNKTNTTNKSTTSATLTEETIKLLVENGLTSKIRTAYPSADPTSCKYKINKSVRNNTTGDYTVYGTVSLYDKYGKLLSGKSQMSFTVKISNGKVKSTTITK